MDREQLEELKELVEFLKANEIAEFDMERSDVKLRLKFASALVAEAPRQQGFAMPYMAPAQVAGVGESAPAVAGGPVPAGRAGVGSGIGSGAAGVVSAAAAVAEVLHEVKSPIVGTFYESPAPGSAPFVKIGDQVEAGQVLCIVEAMKLMNEIEADVAGEIVARIAVPGQPVEYGQPLFAVRAR